MLGDVDVLGPRSYDLKEAYLAVADTIDRFLADVAMEPRLKTKATKQGIRFSRAEDAESCGLSRVQPTDPAFDHTDSLIRSCIHDIRSRAYRDHASVKVAHMFAKRGVTFDSVKEVIKGEIEELLDLPSFDDFGPLFTLNIKSNLSMSLSFNGKKWGETVREQTDLKAKMATYRGAKEDQATEATEGAVSDLASEQEAPAEVTAVTDAASSAQESTESVRDAVVNPRVPTTIEEWEETIDSILGEPEEEKEEASDEEIEAQLQKLLGLMGEELSKVKRHIGRARFFKERVPSETELRDNEGFSNCAHAWDVLYEFYNFIHHVDKARYYLASSIVFLQQSTAIAEEWIAEWESERYWDVQEACEFFEEGSHLGCRKVCYGEKDLVKEEIKLAKSTGRVDRSILEQLRAPRGYRALPGAPDEDDFNKKQTRKYQRLVSATPMKPLTKWKTESLAYDDSAGKKAEKEGNNLIEKASKLFELEYELNETQQALYDMSQNELVQDALKAREAKEEAAAAKSKLRRLWRDRKKKKATDEDSDLKPLLSETQRANASDAERVTEAAVAEAQVIANPMLDRFERFVLGMLKDTTVKDKAETGSTRLNNYGGYVAWNPHDDDAIFQTSKPGEMRLARMLLHIYGNIENKPLSTRAWTKFKIKAGEIDAEALAIKLAFYGVSIVITATTGGAGLAVVLPARAASKACRKASLYALDEKGKGKTQSQLAASLSASRSSDSAPEGCQEQLDLDIDASNVSEFGEKVIAHFLSAQKNMKRIKAQREKMADRRSKLDEWEALRVKYDNARGDAAEAPKKELCEKAKSQLENELREIADELRGRSGDDLKERKKETKEVRESLNKRIESLREILDDWGFYKGQRFDVTEYIDLSDEFKSCDEAAAYVWGTVKFEMHYQKYAFYGTYLLAYVQACLKELCDFEVYLRKRWGNAKKPGDIGKLTRDWITEENHLKHVQETDASGPGGRCATVEYTDETPLLRGKGESGPKQAVGGRKRVIICYGPNIEDNSPDAWSPRHATSLERVQDSVEKGWKDVQKKQEDLAKEWDDLKKKRDKLVGTYEKAQRKLKAAADLIRTAQRVKARSLFD